MKSIKLYVTLFTLIFCNLASATTFTFDDMSTNLFGNPITWGYAGLNWQNFDSISGRTNSGYENGTVSLSNVAANRYGYEDSSFFADNPFTLNSFYLTAGYSDFLNVTVTGYSGSNALYRSTFIVSTASPTLETLNWINVDNVTFSSFGGIHHDGYDGDGNFFVIDNLTLNEPIPSAVPEPKTAAMILIGLFLIGFVMFRRSATD